MRDNEVGSLTHEVGSEVGSVVDIDRCTATNNHLCAPLRALCETIAPTLKQRHRQVAPRLGHQRMIVAERRKERQQRFAGGIVSPVAVGDDQC